MGNSISVALILFVGIEPSFFSLNFLQGQDCFICKKGGHRAKDCPEKYTSSPSDKICLKCGQSGHEMFSCKNDYSPDDLKVLRLVWCTIY